MPLVIVPHAHEAYSGYAADQAYAIARKQYGSRIAQIVLLCTRHDGLPGVLEADLGSSETDHSATVQVQFLDRHFPGAGARARAAYLIGPMDHAECEREARLLHRRYRLAIEKEAVLFVVSGDFMHVGRNYGRPVTGDANSQTKRIEATVVRILGRLSESTAAELSRAMEAEPHTMCGANALYFVAHLFWLWGHVGQVACYYTSDRARGSGKRPRLFAAPRNYGTHRAPDGVVSYIAMVYRAGHPSPEADAKAGRLRLTPYEGTSLIRYAREVVRGEARGGAPVPDFYRPFEVPGLLVRSAGVFVTLTEGMGGALRGCIGTIDNAERLPLLECVRKYAREAAARDPRFPPVRAEEVDGLEVSVTLLGATRPTSLSQWQIGRDGLAMECRFVGRAIYLPDVPTEQGWTKRQTYGSLFQKLHGVGRACGSKHRLFAAPGQRIVRSKKRGTRKKKSTV